MKSGNGFSRLRGLAVAGAVSVTGLFSGAGARAASTAIPLDVTRSSAVWSGVDNNNSFPSSSDVTTTNGAVYVTDTTTGFGISDANIGGGGGSRGSSHGDAFDNALILSVDGNLFVNPDTSVDLTGDTVTSDTVAIIAGVNAQVRYNFFPGRPLVRALFSLTNTTGSPISVNAAVLGDYGSDSGTTVRATSNGDTVIDGADLWYITDDVGQPTGQAKPGRGAGGERGGGDPRITLSRYGANASVVPFNALTPGSGSAVFGLRYPVTIAAGATARILVFAELSDPTLPEAGAIAAAADFVSLDALSSAGLLTGLSATEIGEVVNYGQTGGGVPAVPAAQLPVMSPGGLLALFGMLGGFGYFELRRRRKLEAA